MAVKVGESAGSAWSVMAWLAPSLAAANARKVWAAERTAVRVAAGLDRRRRRESASAKPEKSAEAASRRFHRAVASAVLQSPAGRSGC